MKDWLFTGDDYVCDLRVAGVLVRDGKLLVQRNSEGKEYALPGGHVGIGEMMADALVREFQEETGADVLCKKLLWTEECFWSWKGRKVHNLTFYYLIELRTASDIPDTGAFVSQMDNRSVVFGWLPIDELDTVTIYPGFIRQEILRLDGEIKHFITHD